MGRRAFLALSLVILVGCQGRAVRPEPSQLDLGEVFVYLRPLPDAAVRLRIVLAGITAVGADGEPVPLQLRLRELDGRHAGRQRLIAVGRVPPGFYRGLAVNVQGAWLRGEEGEGALLVPTEPVFVAAPLTVGKDGAALVEIAYRHERAVRDGFRFEPEFAAHVPAKPVFSRLGYAAGFGGSYLAVFDRSALEVISVIGVGGGPAAIAVDEAGRRAYTALSEEDSVAVVDIPSGQVVARVRLRAGDRPESLALAPNGTLLCANRDSDTVSVIDARSSVEVDRIPVGDDPRQVLVDRLGRRAYAFNARSDSISVIDVGRRTVVATVTTEAGPLRGAFNRNSDRLYVIHVDSPYLSVVDLGALTRAGRILVGMGAGAIHVDRDTDLIYVAKRGSTVVEVYDPFSLLPIDFLDVPGAASDMLIDREENRLLLALPEEDAVAALDLVTRRTRAVMDVGRTPRALGIMGERR